MNQRFISANEALPLPSAVAVTHDPGLVVGSLQRILIVDGQEINRRMMRAMLKADSYQLLECGRASEAMKLLETEKVDLVVLDLVLPEVSGPELCRWLKSNRKTRFIPVLMLTSVQGVENEIAGIASGADEFLIKPIHPAVVRTRVSSMLRNKALVDSMEEAETILFALAQAVERRDRCTGMHCERLAALSVSMGEALHLPQSDLIALYRGGFLHDIGKISVPDAILFKTGPLTSDEWDVMKRHTVEGEQICKAMRTLAPVLPIIRSHHERLDGSGYPDGLKGAEIPLLAQTLQVVDIYDALTSSRSYKAAFTQDETFDIMLKEADRGWRDRGLVNLFISLMRTRTDCPQNSTMLESLKNMQASLSI